MDIMITEKTFHTHYDQISFGLRSGTDMGFSFRRLYSVSIKVRKEDIALQTFSAEAAIHVNSFKESATIFCEWALLFEQ